jgi:hypothetical protein
VNEQTQPQQPPATPSWVQPPPNTTANVAGVIRGTIAPVQPLVQQASR